MLTGNIMGSYVSLFASGQEAESSLATLDILVPLASPLPFSGPLSLFPLSDGLSWLKRLPAEVT